MPAPSPCVAVGKVIGGLPGLPDEVRRVIRQCATVLERLDDEQDRRAAVACLVMAVRLDLLSPDGERLQ
jgi:hypothetical protein